MERYQTSDYLVKHKPTRRSFLVSRGIGTPCRAIGYLHNINKDIANDVSDWSILIDGRFTTFNEDWNRTDDCCPCCGGYADNGYSRDVPPVPYACTECCEYRLGESGNV